MNKRMWVCLLISLMLPVFLVGCWDRVEIEERGFVVGIAIDLKEKQQNEEYTLTMTNQVVVPSGLGTPSQGGSKTEAFINLSASGKGMFEIIREISLLTSRALFYPHLQVIVFSADIAKEPNLIGSILDIFIRDHEMRRSVSVVITEGEAKKVLDIQPEIEDLPAMFIQEIMENSEKNAEAVEPVRVGKVHGYLLRDRSYVIPRVVLTEDNIDYKGAGVFQGQTNQMVGILNGEETEGLNYITGTVKGGSIKAEVDGKLNVMEIKGAGSNIKIEGKTKESLEISVDISVEGRIEEKFGTKSVLQPSYVKEVEKKMADEIEKIANKTIKKVQEELNVDVLGFSDILRQRHYNLWEELKGDWDAGENYFSQTPIKVSATVKIKGSGASDQVKEEE
ncbi:Ger(x)C family spore germination protein [Virgibacillus byunsanensis]|uniref:Ger(X)C family spore germination protein n=1 Tax=Virgibacillus byunsanensis TaxID=570945 RepID=A0ABW3LLW3_9BACI